MKRIVKWQSALLVLAALLVVGVARPVRAEVSVSVSVGGFYDELSPYGSWVDVSGYGRCWRPSRVDIAWQPYVDGEWIYTDYGWTWVSSDPWGDDPYHYGSWFYAPGYGWVWVPGTVWAPAWVTWYYTDSYVGWAPLPPTISFGFSGYSGAPLIVSATHYVFVPTNRFAGVTVSSARLPAAQNSTYLRRGTAITRFDVSGGILRSGGPDPRRIESVTHSTIRRSSIRELKAPPRPFETRSSGGSSLSIVAPRSTRDAEIRARVSHGQGQGQGTKATSEPLHAREKAATGESVRTREEAAGGSKWKAHGRSADRHGKATSTPAREGQDIHSDAPPTPPPPAHTVESHPDHSGHAGGPPPNSRQANPAADHSHGKGTGKPPKEEKPKKDDGKN